VTDGDYASLPEHNALFDLRGRRALVTGGGGGLGSAMAEGLRAAGAEVALIGRSDATDRAAARIPAAAVRADLSDPDDLRRGFAEAVELLGGLDILVTSHGQVHASPALEHSPAAWAAILDANLTAVFEVCRLAGAIFVAQGSGKIVNIASMLSFSGGLNVVSYAASKGGVAQLTKALANEWAGHGVNVNAIAPGYFRTSANAHIWRDDPVRTAQIIDRLPAGRWGEPADLRGAVVFLSSPASDYVHGVILPVDGGWLSR
jgi:2-deoxy-D-gluconate 3-dehydrogenase